MGGQGLGGDRGDRAQGREERDAQREGAYEQRRALERRAEQAVRGGTQAHALAAGGAHDHPPEERRHERLRDRCAQAGTRHPQVEGVHEHPVGHRVEDRAYGRRDQGSARVLQPAQGARGRQDDEHADEAGRGGTQVGQGVRHGGRVGPQPGEQGRGEDGQEDRGEGAESSRQPHGLDPRADRMVASPGPQVAARQGGRRVGEEDEEPDRRVQHGRRDAQARQLRGSQMAHHRGVNDGEQRLRDQGPQRGQCERQDHPRGDRRGRRGRVPLTLRG